MRINLKRFGRWSLLAVVTAALWLMGPVWNGAMFTEQAVLADMIGPHQIDRLGRGLALETYYDVASSAQVSGGGYGGPGHSGGDGDALVRIVNVGNFAAALTPPGPLCANIYVFDDIQQLQECCSCLVTADGVRTLSTINDLTKNPAFNGAKMSLGAIKVVGSETFFGTCFSKIAAELDPGGLAEGLKAWINHAETIATNLPPFGFTTSTSVDEFANAPLDVGELEELTINCRQLFAQASGAGVCTCGSGDNGLVTAAASEDAKVVRRRRRRR